MLDIVQLHLSAGKGGDGSVSFHRAKYKPKGGPNGGDGADGGSLYIVGTKHRNTLQQYAGKTAFSAEPGEPGSKKNMSGRKGEDLYLEVPLGTVIWELVDESAESEEAETSFDEKEEVIHRTDQPEDSEGVIDRKRSQNEHRDDDRPKRMIAEILEDGQTIRICKGGKGGRGNDRFKSASNQTPMFAERGTKGEEKDVIFELKLLADVGLVGFPNAGKSTFLSLVTKANPKIGNYPFTTIEPNLGILHLKHINREVVIADIPGLVEGASQGKGLGLQFLRHIDRCRALMYVLFLEEATVFDTDLSDEQKAELLIEQFGKLQKELREYNTDLLTLPMFISVNKADLYNEELQSKITQLFKKKKLDVVLWSGVTSSGVDDLTAHIQKVLGYY